MKKPTYKHNSKHLSVSCPGNLSLKQLTALAARVRYVGSSDHKWHGNSFFPPPATPRPTASLCDNVITLAVANKWLKQGISRGNINWFEPAVGYPRYVWFINDDNIVYEARLTNPGNGEYKGYPLYPDQQVKGLK